MKKIVVVLFVVVLLLSPVFANGKKQASKAENEFAYLVGYATAKNVAEQYKGMFGEQATKVALSSLIKGVKDFVKGKEITNDDYNRIQNAFQTRIEEANNEKKEANLKIAEDFLEKNKEKENVQVTPSGLQYLVLKEGDGEPLLDNTSIKVDYRMSAGTDYDNKIDEGKDITFDINGLIPGVTEGIKLMNVGSKYRLYIHPELGYGEYGNGKIEPNSLLIFDVKLNEIVK